MQIKRKKLSLKSIRKTYVVHTFSFILSWDPRPFCIAYNHATLIPFIEHCTVKPNSHPSFSCELIFDYTTKAVKFTTNKLIISCYSRMKMLPNIWRYFYKILYVSGPWHNIQIGNIQWPIFWFFFFFFFFWKFQQIFSFIPILLGFSAILSPCLTSHCRSTPTKFVQHHKMKEEERARTMNQTQSSMWSMGS